LSEGSSAWAGVESAAQSAIVASAIGARRSIGLGFIVLSKKINK
jgi:hypothetical protein